MIRVTGLPRWSLWRRTPVRVLADFVKVLGKGERAAYWRLLCGGDHWAVLLIHHGRKGDKPPPEPQPVRLAPKYAELARQRREKEAQARDDLLASIWLYVNWRYVSKQLTTPQKELWADAIDRRHAAMNAEDPGIGLSPVARWWRDDYVEAGTR